MVFFKKASKPAPDLVRDAEPYKPAAEGVVDDMAAPLAHYFVSSSHNTYLHGHQLVGKGGTDVITTCLLAGCRVVELDTYNEETKGKLANKGPQVRHGEALTSAVSFEECMVAVHEHAFKKSPYPVICTFENHCDHDNQRKMAEILIRVLGNVLFVLPEAGEEQQVHASPDSLKNKVLIRTKVESNGKEVCPELKKLVYIQNAKMKAILESDLPMEDQAGVSCSVEAGKLDDLLENKEQVLRFTTRHILRIYPQAWRINSANYNPIPAWNMGAQVVALNWQKYDRDMQMYQTKFLANGGCGMVKKPQWMIEGKLPNKPPFPKLLTVRVLSAGMEKRKVMFKRSLEDLHVKVEVAGEAQDCRKYKTRTEWNTWEAHFDEQFCFHVHYPEIALLLVQLRDKDNHSKKDDVLGYYGIVLDTVSPGTWLLPLRSPETGEVHPENADGTPLRWVTVELGWQDDASPAAMEPQGPDTPMAPAVDVSGFDDPKTTREREQHVSAAEQHGTIGGHGVAYDPGAGQTAGGAGWAREVDKHAASGGRSQAAGNVTVAGKPDMEMHEFRERKFEEASGMDKEPDFRPGATDKDVPEGSLHTDRQPRGGI